MTDYGAYDAGKPCLNPSCKSHGRPHPGCRCYPGLAHGGTVCEQRLQHHPECEYFAEGGDVEQSTHFNENPELAVEHAVANHGLLHALTKTGHSRSENPGKSTEDFIDSAHRGRKKVDHHMDRLIGKEKMDLEPSQDDRDALKSHLDEIQANPLPLLSVGGSLGEHLPSHATHLSAMAGRAVSYLNGMRPQGAQGGPLDEVQKPSKIDHARYDRNLDVAQNPLLVLKRAKHNVVHPEDLKTLQTLYPALTQSFIDKATGRIIDAKTKGQTLSHSERQGIGKLLGQPLSLNQTPAAMQAIKQANAMAQAPSQGGHQKKPGTKAAVDESDKQAQLQATPLQARQLNRKI